MYLIDILSGSILKRMRGTFMNCKCSISLDDQPPHDGALLPVAVGMVLRRVREHKCFTQADLAAEADMNLSYISNVENGQNNISIMKFYLLCNALTVHPNDVLGRACQLLGALRLLIRNRTAQEAALLLRKYSPDSLEVGALINAGFIAHDHSVINMKAILSEAVS